MERVFVSTFYARIWVHEPVFWGRGWSSISSEKAQVVGNPEYGCRPQVSRQMLRVGIPAQSIILDKQIVPWTIEKNKVLSVNNVVLDNKLSGK